MLWTTNDPVVNQSISIENIIDEVSNSKVIFGPNDKESKTELLTSGPRLAFAKLKQVFSIVAILHHFDL